MRIMYTRVGIIIIVVVIIITITVIVVIIHRRLITSAAHSFTFCILMPSVYLYILCSMCTTLVRL